MFRHLSTSRTLTHASANVRKPHAPRRTTRTRRTPSRPQTARYEFLRSSQADLLGTFVRRVDAKGVETSLLAASIAPAAADTSDSAATANRRRSERVAAPVPGWVSGESNDRGARGRDVSVNDLSMHGIGFRDARASYRVGATHWLVVNGGAMRLSTRIRIISCRASEAGGFDVGAKFF